MSLGQDRFLDAIAEYGRAMTTFGPSEKQRAHEELIDSYHEASPATRAEGGPRLAAVLDTVPETMRGHIAVLVGACVEEGADPVACAPRVLGNLAKALDGARTFAEMWRTAESDEEVSEVELPDPKRDPFEDPESVLAELGMTAPSLYWWTLPQWRRAAHTMLSHAAVRKLCGPSIRESLLDRNNALAEAGGEWDKCTAYALQVLDDEPLIVLHRATGTGYRMRISGMGDNFQLHTLVADALINGGHVTGEYAPSAEAVAACLDAEGMVPTIGSFLMYSPDGNRVWNEGTPADIPLTDGMRVLVLDPAPYPHHWPAGRFFPNMLGELTLTEVLDAAETARWFAHVGPPTGVGAY
ncbi:MULTISPECIES: hypothetical protein [unclassified Nocardia]|uniref:hypothetical protein n=1 Tax=unclassified Nocardia TaxID=2637762 RepID=UPI001CE4989F|nr:MULTISPECIES: hypothetical protein [unclassified Nocardia]